MHTLHEEIVRFLQQCGFESELTYLAGQEIILVRCVGDESSPARFVVPQKVCADSSCEAREQAENLRHLLQSLEAEGQEIIVITEDRWRSQGDMMRARLLAHLERFTSLYARFCCVKKVDKDVAREFLMVNHSYGDAACRYRYGLYLRRPSRCGTYEADTLVAVATFSNARKWQKGDKVIRSYEWTRYASLPRVRISGGMGKVLKAFIEEVHPDDIMSYADLEWSEGKVYEQLGFVLEGRKDPVMFVVDEAWRRFPVKLGMTETSGGGTTAKRFFQNLGSNKYRLKLTQYE